MLPQYPHMQPFYGFLTGFRAVYPVFNNVLWNFHEVIWNLTLEFHIYGTFGASVQLSSVAQACPTLRPHELQHTRPPCPSPTPRVHPDSFPSSRWCHPSSHLIFCCPFFFLPPIPPSIRVFSNESTLRMRWPKYWSFSFSIIPSKESS